MIKRVFIYGLVIFSFAGAVVIKQNVITRGRKRKIVSAPSEWEEKGKPVILEKVIKEDVNTYTKVTVTQGERGFSYAYVPLSIQQELSSRQKVFLDNENKEPAGEVVEVSREIDLDTGMFLVKLKLKDGILADKDSRIVYINTGTLRKTICLPSKIIFSDEDKYFVWVSKEGKAHKAYVKLGKANGYGVLIKEGLKEGDLVVIEGYTKLFEGNKLREVSDELYE